MSNLTVKFPLGFALAVFFTGLAAAATRPPLQYHIYAGNTHAHTAYTWSHGAQWNRNGCTGIREYVRTPPSSLYISTWRSGYVKRKPGSNCASIFVINGWQFPGSQVTLKPDWQTYQGPPSKHFEVAKADGYDFYITTDHSQEAIFDPPTSDNPTWSAAKRQSLQATDSKFVAQTGFEYSENDGPGGTGHINVINTAGILNALMPGINLPYLYRWLERAQSNGAGPVVASFNHPGPHQYNDWSYRDPKITNIITMLEVINSNNHIHYQGFVNALDKGWKVSPISGLDNHGLGGINKDTSRTFVLAPNLTKVGILDAMKNRRTYASLDKNIQCRYSVNGAVMGSTLSRPGAFRFAISVTDPDTNNAKDKITKLDIVKDGGTVVQTYTPPVPAYTVHWNPTITDSAARFFFVRVWNAGGGDAPGADPAKPIAWLAPVWTGR